MASELKPCPFCGGADVNLYHSAKTFMSWVSCKSCGLDAPSETGITDEEAITYWNTRPAPAATDTGLVTVGEVSTVRESIAAFAGHMLSRQLKPGDLLCRRSQAVELFAAERADKRIWMEKAAIEAERVNKLEADNAVLTARVKELDAAWLSAEKQCQSQGEQLAAAKEAAARAAYRACAETRHVSLGHAAADAVRAVLGGKP